MKTPVLWLAGGAILLSALGYLSPWRQEPAAPPGPPESVRTPVREGAGVGWPRAADTPSAPPDWTAPPLRAERTNGVREPDATEPATLAPPLDPDPPAPLASPVDIGPPLDADDPDAGVIDTPTLSPERLGPDLDADDPGAGVIDTPLVNPCQATPETDPLTTPKIDPQVNLVIGLKGPRPA